MSRPPDRARRWSTGWHRHPADLERATGDFLGYYSVTSEEAFSLRTTKRITVLLPGDLLREAQRVAREDARGRSELIREALRDYLASRRWQRLRRWGAETAERLGLKSEEDLQRLLDEIRAGRRKARG